VNPQSVAAAYSVGTFALLAAVYFIVVHFVFGLPYLPSYMYSIHGLTMLVWWLVAGLYARAVGNHGRRGATIGQALRAAFGDLGRGAPKGL